jgi:TPR repeat protein
MPFRMRRRVSRLAVAALACCAVLQAGLPTARGDLAAGRVAFDKGDFVQAMAEWTSAAERGDPEAEFQLGMLHERGDLKQDYKQADHWYEKAAEQGHIGAEYRLAWIWGVGGDDFPADPTEAYKWIILASEKGLATDLKTQLEKVLDRNQQAEARRRAAAWKEAHAAKQAEPAVAGAPGGSGSPSIPPPRASGTTPATTAKSGGCPGWPFPTLPCTEQFPALGGAPAQRTPAVPPPQPRSSN